MVWKTIIALNNCMLPKEVCFKIEFHGKTLVAEIYRIQQLKKSVLLKEVILSMQYYNYKSWENHPNTYYLMNWPFQWSEWFIKSWFIWLKRIRYRKVSFTLTGKFLPNHEKRKCWDDTCSTYWKIYPADRNSAIKTDSPKENYFFNC